jgi:hypothetical protein
VLILSQPSLCIAIFAIDSQLELYFFAVFAEALKAAAVGAPFEPGFAM